ncbi:MAG: O-antigen ligase family protein, partial [Planctomycetota bacterium]
YGLWADRLPGKSLTFRWFYWTATAEMIAEHPAVGVGPGNFESYYLWYRRPAAEEAVKAPHNVVLHALAQYGLPGGVVFLAVLVGGLVAATRPAVGASPAAEPPDKRDRISGRSAAGWALGAGLAALLARIGFEGAGAHWSLLLFEGVAPAVTLAACVLLAWWAGTRFAVGGGVRIALACGAAGLLLHNLLTFSLHTPGAAMLYWLAAGAAAAPAAGVGRSVGRLRWPAAVIGLLAVVGVAWSVYLPAAGRQRHTERMVRAAVRQDRQMAAAAGVAAAQAAPADPLAAADAARMILWSCPRGGRSDVRECARRAERWALAAVRRGPCDADWWILAARTAAYRAVPDLLRYQAPPADAEAVELLERRLARRGRSSRLLAQLAAARADAAEHAEAREVLQQALQIEPDSPVLQARMGDLHWRLGSADAARQAWQRARELAGTDPAMAAAAERLARASARNPAGLRQHIETAELLWWARHDERARVHLQRAERIDAALIKPSVEQLTAEEEARIDLFRARLGAMAAGEATRTWR